VSWSLYRSEGMTEVEAVDVARNVNRSNQDTTWNAQEAHVERVADVNPTVPVVPV
jgi:hypothetical protein